MANFTENNLLYHIFSKSPVSDATTLAQSLNKSGHTLTTDDIFGEELPAFYDVANTTERDDLTAYNNDVCKIGNNFYYYTSKEDGSYGWLDRSAIEDGECLFNRSSEYKNNGTDWKNHAEGAVVKYHKDKDGEFITEDNNGVNGNKFTVRVKKTNGNYIKQFISVTDKIVNSRTSNGYAPLVLQSGSVMEENAKYKDASSDNMRYIANCYAGIIQFPVQKSGTTVASNIKISVWEYIGKTLTDVLKGFATIDTGFNYKVADELPLEEAKWKGWVYLVPSSNSKENNVHDEYICVEDGTTGWKWEQIGTTAITVPGAGDFIKFEDNEFSVKTSAEIEDNKDNDKTVPTTAAVYNHTSNTTIHVTQEDRNRWDDKSDITISEEIVDDPDSVPTTQAVYKHTSDAEIHIPSDQASGSYSGAQTGEGESCHGFILNTNENTRIESIIVVQTNRLGAQWNNKVYCKIKDPITDREFISPKFEGTSFLPHSTIYFVKDGKKANGANEVPYLVKGRDYKLTFWSSETHEPISIKVAYIEPRQTPNAHFGKFITHKILSNNEVVECSYPDIPANSETNPNGVENAFKAAGYTIIPVTRRCDNVHFMDVGNEIANVYDAIGDDNSVRVSQEDKEKWDSIYKTTYDVVSSSGITGNPRNSSSITGVSVTPLESFTSDKIVIGGLPTANSGSWSTTAKLYIWRNAQVNGNDKVITEIQNVSSPSQKDDTYTWLLDSPFTFVQGETYFLTWHGTAPNTTATVTQTSSNKAEIGYKPTVKSYEVVETDTSNIHILNGTIADQNKYFTTNDIITNATIDCKFYYTSGYDTICVTEDKFEPILHSHLHVDVDKCIFESDTTSTPSEVNYNGVGFTPANDFTGGKIIIKGVKNGTHAVNESSHLKMWKNNTFEKYLGKLIVEDAEDGTKTLTCTFNEKCDFVSGQKYTFTMHDNSANETSLQVGYAWKYVSYPQTNSENGICSITGRTNNNTVHATTQSAPDFKVYNVLEKCIYATPAEVEELKEKIEKLEKIIEQLISQN